MLRFFRLPCYFLSLSSFLRLPRRQRPLIFIIIHVPPIDRVHRPARRIVSILGSDPWIQGIVGAGKDDRCSSTFPLLYGRIYIATIVRRTNSQFSTRQGPPCSIASFVRFPRAYLYRAERKKEKKKKNWQLWKHVSSPRRVHG